MRLRGGRSGVSIRIARPPTRRSAMLRSPARSMSDLAVVQQVGFCDRVAHLPHTVQAVVRVLTMPLTDAEQRVCEAIEAGRDELVGLAGALIGFDTTARQVGEPCRGRGALCRSTWRGGSVPLGRRWMCGSRTRPALAGMPLVPPGLSFEGRPQLIARHRVGVGEGGRWCSTGTSTSCPRSLVPSGRAIRSSRPCATGSCTGGGRAT